LKLFSSLTFGRLQLIKYRAVSNVMDVFIFTKTFQCATSKRYHRLSFFQYKNVVLQKSSKHHLVTNYLECRLPCLFAIVITWWYFISVFCVKIFKRFKCLLCFCSPFLFCSCSFYFKTFNTLPSVVWQNIHFSPKILTNKTSFCVLFVKVVLKKMKYVEYRANVYYESVSIKWKDIMYVLLLLSQAYGTISLQVQICHQLFKSGHVKQSYNV